MTNANLLQPILQVISSASTELVSAIETGAPLSPLALRHSARLPVMAALYQMISVQPPRHPLLFIVDRADHALTLLDEFSLWLPDAPRFYFPEPNPLFYENAPWGATTRRDRLTVLTALAAYHIPGAQSAISDQRSATSDQQSSISNLQSPIIVAPLRAILSRTLPRRDFLKAVKSIKREQIIQPDELARAAMTLGYENVNIVTSSGQFSRRGGILDLWPPTEPQPVRVEFFGDEIDTLRRFDPATQRTITSLEKVLLTLAREYVTSATTPLVPDGWGLETGAPLSEFHIPLLHPSPASAIDYLPRQSLVLLDDRQALADTAAEIEEQAVQLRHDLSAEGTLPEDFPIPYLTFSEIEDALPMGHTIELGGPVFDENADIPKRVDIASFFSPGNRFAGRLKPALDQIAEAASRRESVFIVSRQSTRLQELWAEQSIPQSAIVNPQFIEGSLSEGFTFTPPSGSPIYLFTDGELFGWRRPEARLHARLAAEAPEAAYADLQTGDWVVHVDHGVGKFLGLFRRMMEGIERDYLAVEYADGDQLYVPVYQADRLTRYVGPENREPTATRLGSTEWKTDKTKAKEAAEEVAEDLLELYAQRQVVPGYAFAADSPWQQELEASFPYIETTDQLRVLKEVKRDMETPRPMDRLICGDVGYGKTEVALRAAFKAVMDGRQVAVLVPTTVLAQQHFRTFRERLAAFPAEVEMLSRFRTHLQQRDILHRLAIGSVDIVIGTHRLISEDVHFKDLGLLIIDEEQRFGVTHKETLKKLRTEVDVLTLTATPIPRTLYMALTGVRDISTINTPPEERLPIVTHVGPYNQKIVRQAMVRELERGGQVYFVHNRVQTIESMAAHLRKLIPEARITIGHGQLDEDTLADRMEHFAAGDFDILLCTTIIESGLDIPNCNTLIVDRADTFGLAQLYQLRGRVGRGAQRAYAYFFRHNKIAPTPEGRQRLDTIAENTQLGAGFSIAMRDLEIRGSGEILGARQSGHIAAVGFHLYTRLLADAVRRLRLASRAETPEGRLPPVLDTHLSLPVNVDLPLPVGLPVSYVADQETRLRLYRRMADIRSLPEVDAITDEFADRFGPPPEEVRNLLYQVRLKLLAEKAGLASVSAEAGQIVFRYPTLPEGVQARDLTGLPDLSDMGVRKGKNALWMAMTGHPEDGWQTRLAEVLDRLASE
jgi:transcription-repair coupling factor (superfamily II helicase)